MVEELEKKMESKIEEVRDMMLDRFSGVDRKLTAIEELLKKITENQNQTRNPPEKDTCKGGVESSTSRAKGNKLVIGERDGGLSREYGGQETIDKIWGPLGKQGQPWEAGSSFGWVGLYTDNYGKENAHGSDFGAGKDLRRPAWLDQQESNFSQKSGPHEGTRTQRGRAQDGFEQKVVKSSETGWCGNKSKHENKWVVKASQDETVTDSLTFYQWRTKESWLGSSDKVADKADVGGEKEKQTGSWAPWRKNKDNKTEVSLQDSLKANRWGNKDCGSWGKQEQNERTDKCGSVESDKGHDKIEQSSWIKKVKEKTNSKDSWGGHWGKKADEDNRIQGSWGWNKNDDWGPKRKRPNSPVGDPNDGPRLSGSFHATKQRSDFFTSDEEKILAEIEPIMESIRRILHQDGYKDGEPLSADDQTYIINNVFNHHPNKDQKMGAGVDCIMVDKHTKHQESRCLYVLTTDGRKEDFSYHKCLKNFVRVKYPDKVDKFIPKYMKMTRPCPPGNTDHGYGADEAGSAGLRSGWNLESYVSG